MNRTDNFNIHSTNIWVDYEPEYLNIAQIFEK